MLQVFAHNTWTKTKPCNLNSFPPFLFVYTKLNTCCKVQFAETLLKQLKIQSDEKSVSYILKASQKHNTWVDLWRDLWEAINEESEMSMLADCLETMAAPSLHLLAISEKYKCSVTWTVLSVWSQLTAYLTVGVSTLRCLKLLTHRDWAATKVPQSAAYIFTRFAFTQRQHIVMPHCGHSVCQLSGFRSSDAWQQHQCLWDVYQHSLFQKGASWLHP